MSNTLKDLIGDLPTVEPVETTVEDLEQEQPQEETPQEVVKDETPTVVETPEKKPVEQTQSVPLPIVMELKHDMRDLKQNFTSVQQENQQLKQQLQQLQTHEEPKEAQPDPLQVHIKTYRDQYYEENGEYPDTKSIPVPADVILARDEWREQQVQQTSAQAQAQVRANALAAARTSTMTDTAFGEGLGIDSVVGIGEAFLTEGDKLDIQNAGDKCPDVMYRRCYDRAVASGTPQGIALAQRMHAALNPKQPTVPKAPPVQTKAPSAEEVLDRPRYHNLTNLGLVG